MPKDSYDVKVKDHGTLYTGRAGGKSASSESSIAEVVKSVAEKLWGVAPHGMALLARDADGTTHWKIRRAGSSS